MLWGKLLDAVQRLCRTLRSQRRVCRSLSLTIRYSDQVEVTKQERLTPETCWEVDLSPHLYALFQRVLPPSSPAPSDDREHDRPDGLCGARLALR